MLYRIKKDPSSCEEPSERGERERKRLEDETGSFQDRWGIVEIYKREDRRIPNSGEALPENIYQLFEEDFLQIKMLDGNQSSSRHKHILDKMVLKKYFSNSSLGVGIKINGE